MANYFEKIVSFRESQESAGFETAYQLKASHFTWKRAGLLRDEKANPPVMVGSPPHY
jgi:hypothetical protein